MFSFNSKPKSSFPWRPNFTDPDYLPDVKLVRTEFLINFVPVLLFCGLFIYFGITSFGVMHLKNEVDALETDIKQKMTQNDLAVSKANEFDRNTSILQSVRAYYNRSITPLQYLMLIAEYRPAEIIFDQIEFARQERDVPLKPGVVKKSNKDQDKEWVYLLSMSGSIPGNYDDALEQLNQYKAMLKRLEAMTGVLEEIEISSLRRDPELGVFTYDFKIILKPKDESGIPKE